MLLFINNTRHQEIDIPIPVEITQVRGTISYIRYLKVEYFEKRNQGRYESKYHNDSLYDI